METQQNNSVSGRLSEQELCQLSRQDVPHLSYIHSLGFRVLSVASDRWAHDAPLLLLEAAMNTTFIASLEEMALANTNTLKAVYGRAQRAFSEEVCAVAALRLHQ